MAKSATSQFLRPERFEVDPDSPGAGMRWTHWKCTFENFLSDTDGISATESAKLKLLINHLSPTVYNYIHDCKDYTTALKQLEGVYLKPKNEILARHLLSTRKQRSDETIPDYLRSLKLLAQDCKYEDVTAIEYQNESIRGAFIAGIRSQRIRERLLEKTLTLEGAKTLAISLETAETDSKAFSQPMDHLNATKSQQPSKTTNFQGSYPTGSLTSSFSNSRRCYFCGGNIHQRIKCPAFNALCQLCNKKGILQVSAVVGPNLNNVL
ncbi:hypothetical protein NE865_09717 [Phthorimaea operculella]|nr:hypothetical protein NE865_09717 [Phthorimaea operculella]